MATERDAHERLKRLLPPGAFCQRVENSVGTGTPDTYVTCRGLSLWVENKVGDWYHTGPRYLRVPKSKLRVAQSAWLTSHVQQGGVALISVLATSEGRIYLLPFSHETWHKLGEGLAEPIVQSLALDHRRIFSWLPEELR